MTTSVEVVPEEEEAAETRTEEQLREEEEMKQDKQIDLAFQVGKYILGLIFVIMFFTRVIRPIINWMTTSVEVVAEEAEEAETKTEEQLREEEEMKRLEEGLASATEMRESVTTFIEKDPAYTAGVMRKWMREKA